MKNVEVTMTAIVALETRALAMVLKELAVRERQVTVDFLLHLMEFDNRRGWVDFDCRSLFEFCRSELGLLECATSQRIRAVKILRQFPQVEPYLRDGRFSVTSIAPLLTVLNEENADALFERCAGLSRKNVQKVVEEVTARLRPIAGPKPRIRALPEKTIKTESPEKSDATEARGDDETAYEEVASPTEIAPQSEGAADAFTLVAQVARRLSITLKQVNAREFGMYATVDQNFVDLVEQLRNLYSHLFPGGDLVEVIRRALQVAIEEKLKQKVAKTKSPRASRANEDETITAETKRIVWERDGGGCAWRYPDGRVCGSQWMLEFDHIESPKHGGSSRPASVRVACRDHNQQHARNTFGDDHIERKKKERKRTKD